MFSSEIAMGRRPIAIGKISQKVPPQEGRYLVLAFYTERGASHLRARCARGSACRRCSLQLLLVLLCQPATTLA